MSDRLEKLFTLTDIENLEDAPVTIEAGGLIKDNKTGRVIARMYFKNCADKPLNSVLVGFRPMGENGRTISGMRDYLYDAKGVPVGEIFGDQTGILFDNNDTKSFSADVEEVDFEDGGYWDAAEAKKKAEELKLIVPEEKEQPEQAPEMWEKPAEKTSAPAVWDEETHEDEPHSAEIYGAAVVEQKFGEPDEGDFVPASIETRQLGHEERPALEEQTDAFREKEQKEVIELEGPSEEEQPVIELGGPTAAEEPAEQPEAEAPEMVLVPEEPADIEAYFEKPAEAEKAPAEETEEAPAETSAEAPAEEARAEEAPTEEPVPEEEPEPAEEPAPEEPEKPVKLADMYGGAVVASELASYAAAYEKRIETPEEEPEAYTEAPAEEPAAEEPATEETPAEEPVPSEEPVAEETPAEEPAPAEELVPEEPADIEAYFEKPAEAPEEAPAEAAPAEELVPEEPAPAEAEPVLVEEPAPEAAEPVLVEEPAPETEDQWAGYGIVQPTEEKPEEKPFTLTPAEPEAEPAPEEPEPVKEPAPEPEEEAAEEYIPKIEDTIELPKAVAPEKNEGDAEEILAAVAAKEEMPAEKPEEEKPEEEKKEEAEEAAAPAAQKADVVFAQEEEVLPSIIQDKEKALTGEDHSGRNLMNIVVFGGIALIILLVLLLKM